MCFSSTPGFQISLSGVCQSKQQTCTLTSNLCGLYISSLVWAFFPLLTFDEPSTNWPVACLELLLWSLHIYVFFYWTGWTWWRGSHCALHSNSPCCLLVVGKSVHCPLLLPPIHSWPNTVHFHWGLLFRQGMVKTTQHLKQSSSLYVSNSSSFSWTQNIACTLMMALHF